MKKYINPKTSVLAVSGTLMQSAGASGSTSLEFQVKEVPASQSYAL